MSHTPDASCITTELHLIAAPTGKQPLTVEDCLYRIAALSAAILLLISLV